MPRSYLIPLTREINATDIVIGKIIWFNNEYIPSNELHPHIIIAFDENIVHFVCGTTKQSTIERKCRNHNIDESLFPCINPDSHNKLNQPTFFNCYHTFNFSLHKINNKITGGERICFNGNVLYSQYEQIRNGLKQSPTVDFIDLLIHPEDN